MKTLKSTNLYLAIALAATTIYAAILSFAGPQSQPIQNFFGDAPIMEYDEGGSQYVGCSGGDPQSGGGNTTC